MNKPLLAVLCALALAPESAAQIAHQVLEANDPTGKNEFGADVVLDGPDRLLVASRQATGVAAQTGAVYLFERDAAGAWQRTGKLFAPDGHYQHYFENPAVEGDDLLIGAWGDNEAGGGQDGAIYAYGRVGGQWVLNQKILNPVPATTGQFGIQLSLHDGYAFVPHAGLTGIAVVRIYEKQAGSWVQVQEWTPASTGFSSAFPMAVVGDGPGRVLFGDSGWIDPASGKRTGRVVVLEESGGIWSEVDSFRPVGMPGNGSFGSTLAVSGDHLLVGAMSDAGGLGPTSGAFYHFTRDAQGLWRQRQKFKAPDGSPLYFFGRSLDLAGDRAVVTGVRTTIGGAAYLYQLRAGRFELQTRLDVQGTTDNSWYGMSSAILGDEVLVGARVHWQYNGDGRVYTYDWPQGVQAFGQCGGAPPTGQQASLAPLPPCGNAYAFGGCENSTGRGGMLLAGGTTSVTSDDLRLIGDQLPAGQLVLLSMASERRFSAAGDGLSLLAGGAASIFQFSPAVVDVQGSASFGPGLVAESAAFGSGAILAGSSWFFQAQYADPSGPCGTGANMTSALRVTFIP